MDKRAAVDLLSSATCRITEFRLGESQITRLTPDAALLAHRTDLTGTYNGTPLAPAYSTLTVYVREAGQWKIAYWAQSAIVDPMQATIPTDSDLWTSGATSDDPATQALLAREVEVVNAWKDHDGDRMAALFGPELQFVDIFGAHIGTRSEALKAWSGEGCDVKEFEFTGAQARLFTPEFGALTYRADYRGTCFGQDLWPIWATAFYVRRGDDWLWSSGINVLAGAPE
ncbi:MAG: nuclear transport factor 2 family protein [Parvularculaceae bacterium]